MLAGYGPPADDLDYWSAEPKLDGWRAIVTIDQQVTVRTRGGHHLLQPRQTVDELAEDEVCDLARGFSIREVVDTYSEP